MSFFVSLLYFHSSFFVSLPTIYPLHSLQNLHSTLVTTQHRRTLGVQSLVSLPPFPVQRLLTGRICDSSHQDEEHEANLNNVRVEQKHFQDPCLIKTGAICLDILKTAWSPAWTLQSVCRAIIALMAHPEPDSPLNCDSGNLLRLGDVRGYKACSNAKERLINF
ncbi:uncharacterized protein LOC131631206 [Vicia villosa]|uniref:uncharacterized protein LOC131631206 n=1 Tax=Vicia villosa TaxID=3911 RepID=UPI00273C30B6|nr:uncharacterized protein LOC131631206 [Vicia villosa]